MSGKGWYSVFAHTSSPRKNSEQVLISCTNSCRSSVSARLRYFNLGLYSFGSGLINSTALAILLRDIRVLGTAVNIGDIGKETKPLR